MTVNMKNIDKIAFDEMTVDKVLKMILLMK